MTTNAGAREITNETIGFKETFEGSKSKSAIERTFSPEFRNRLDAWITFGQLDTQVIKQVVDKFVTELQQQLQEKAVTIELTETARDWFAQHGYDKLHGARPMNRLIQSKVKEPLAEELLFGQLQQGGKAIVDIQEGVVVLKVQSTPAQ
jgi:ATP-dependent Clp protease ATP-binding subunit ClpA